MEETRIICGVGSKSYEIFISDNFLERIPQLILSLVSSSKYAIITDENVYRLHGKRLILAFESYGIKVFVKVLPPGESTKCREMKAQLEDWLLDNDFHRDSCILAFGGGVVGDLCGFVAATYMRGIPFIQIPTTLLACVDSSIGGKTGIDCMKGKNLIGAFHAPLMVLIDLSLLKTLSKREFANGMAEVIKAGAIRNEKLFRLLEDQIEEICSQQNPKLLLEMISLAVQVKTQIVTLDEKEHGIRSILNFGHSIGHGIEALLQPDYLHGECVAIGMCKEAQLARFLGYCSSSTVHRLCRCLKAYNLPLKVPEHISICNILEKMQVDKKNKGKHKRLNMLKEIGNMHLGDDSSYTIAVKDNDISFILEKAIQILPSKINSESKLRVPGSKSISNRVLLLAALGRGSCCISGLLHSDDTQVMMNALIKLGASFEWKNNGQDIIVHGTGGVLLEQKKSQEIYLGNAGTAFRFLTCVATLIAPSTGDEKIPIVLTGDKRMKERPTGDLVDALRSHGCQVNYLEEEGFPPIAVYPTGLKGGNFFLHGKVSSQFVSSVLLSSPYAKDPITLELAEEHPTSLPYILMTLSLMRQFGIQVEQKSVNSFFIPNGSYLNPPVISIEVDASSATYPLAMAAITGSCIELDGLGTSSLQGDSNFFTILEEMGCKAVQTETTTCIYNDSSSDVQVKPVCSKSSKPIPSSISTTNSLPSNSSVKKLKAIQVNMENMTDAFMTAAVLCVVANGKSEITGIENQRVKECNRIEVMIQELTKLGVSCGELPDGLWIEGVEDLSTLHPLAVSCHNDHRIAMSFAVLSCVVPNITITDKDCTEKTYPEFWEDCINKLSLRINPVPSFSSSSSSFTSSKTIFLIGMRGVGKSTFGNEIAQLNSYDFIDMDSHLEKIFHCTIKDFISERGWIAFRKEEEKLLHYLLFTCSHKKCIVACGGGIVESKNAVLWLESYPHVIHLQRDIKLVEENLHTIQSQHNNNMEGRPAYAFNEEFSSVWKRRQSLYYRASSYDFILLKEEQHEVNRTNGQQEFVFNTTIAQDFIGFLKRTDLILESNSSVSEASLLYSPQSSNTFFVSLTFAELNKTNLDLIENIVQGADAVEFRVDLLRKNDDSFYILTQLALLRRALTTLNKTSLPIIYTVRTKSQGGLFPDDQEELLFNILQLGQRAGCEFIDMEAIWSLKKRLQLAQQKRQSKIISSYHALGRSLSDEEILQLFITCSSLNKNLKPQDDALIDVVKVVIEAFQVEDSLRIHRIKQNLDLNLPLIALCTQEQGKLSRVLNSVLTPVTHKELPFKAAKGQLTISEIMDLRTKLGIIQEKKFYLFGSSIQHSPSPDIHNAAFKYCYLPYSYSLVDTNDIQELVKVMNSNDFGGASVTIPYKESLFSYIDEISEAVKEIGALNTIIAKETVDGKKYFVGDNTDWLGILYPLEKRLIGLNLCEKNALVLGAGGTSRAACYALKHLGFNLFIFNRTYSRAIELGQTFHGKAIEDLSLQHLPTKIDIVLSTLPPSANVSLPSSLFHKDMIVMDVLYKPNFNGLLKQAKSSNNSVLAIEGSEMMLEQAIKQFTLWTGKSAPMHIYKRTLEQLSTLE